MSDVVGFFRKDGHIIPIRKGAAAATAAGRTVKVAHAATQLHKGIKEHGKSQGTASSIKVHRGLDALGLGLSVASGVVSAATFSSGAKGFFGGAVASHAIDAAGIAANVGSVAGKGRTKDRAKVAAKNEARNFVIGNGVFVAGLIGMKRNRATIASGAQKAIALGRKLIRGV